MPNLSLITNQAKDYWRVTVLYNWLSKNPREMSINNEVKNVHLKLFNNKLYVMVLYQIICT